jgi:hypothetical protein
LYCSCISRPAKSVLMKVQTYLHPRFRIDTDSKDKFNSFSN